MPNYLQELVCPVQKQVSGNREIEKWIYKYFNTVGRSDIQIFVYKVIHDLWTLQKEVLLRPL